MKRDVIIIGSGPAGMFAANELQGRDVLVIDLGSDIAQRTCVMEETGKCANCVPCNRMCGIGGAGTFSDGTLNLHPEIGGDLYSFVSEESAWKLVDHVDKIFVRHGTPKYDGGADEKEVEFLKRRAASVGAKFVETNQKHIGSDETAKIVSDFKKYLEQKGVEFLVDTKVSDLIIEDGECKGVKIGDREIYARYILLAPGRSGVTWVNELIDKHHIRAKYGPIDIGVRVEVPAIIMDPVTRVNRDPKFYVRTKKYDDLARTFCTNEHGFITKESYGGFIGINGHSFRNIKSENTNFAFLISIELTKPLEDTTKYGESIAKLSTTIGGGRPIIQTMGDLRRGRRSTWNRIKRDPIKNTLDDVTPGDISMALPHRVVMDVIEGLERINEIIPGVASDSTLLYAPEIKFYARRIHVSKNMETSVKKLFVAGDGAGLSRDIINAAATGVLAGRGICETLH